MLKNSTLTLLILSLALKEMIIATVLLCQQLVFLISKFMLARPSSILVLQVVSKSNHQALALALLLKPHV